MFNGKPSRPGAYLDQPFKERQCLQNQGLLRYYKGIQLTVEGNSDDVVAESKWSANVKSHAATLNEK
jgi:hypothetical protein